MSVETNPQFISDLNPDWPLDADLVKVGAEHLRNIKKTEKQTFPNITGAVTTTHTNLNLLTDNVIASTTKVVVKQPIDAQAKKITNVANPTVATDVMTKGYADANYASDTATAGLKPKGDIILPNAKSLRSYLADGTTINTMLATNANDSVILGNSAHPLGISGSAITVGGAITSNAAITCTASILKSATPNVSFHFANTASESFNLKATAADTLTASKKLHATGELSTAGNLVVAGQATTAGNITVGTPSVNAGIIVNGDLNVGKNVSIQGTTTTGDINCQTTIKTNNLSASTGGLITANNTIHALGDVNVNGNFTTNGTTVVHGIFNIDGSNDPNDTQGYISYNNAAGTRYNSLYSEKAGDMTLMVDGQGTQKYFLFQKSGLLDAPQIRSRGDIYVGNPNANDCTYQPDCNITNRSGGNIFSQFSASDLNGALIWIKNNPSDRNMKHDIVDCPTRDKALDRISAIQTKEFTWNDGNSSRSQLPDRGFIAQELHDIDSRYAYAWSYGGKENWAYSDNALMADLIDSVKTLKARIEVLEAKGA